MNKVISAFPGIGKTTLVQTNKNYIDLESSDYKWLDIDKTLSIEERKDFYFPTVSSSQR